MIYFLTKTLVSALLIAGISELMRRFPLLAAALASLPLVSILAMIWARIEGTGDGELIAFSYDVFWLVLPSLLFFLAFPALLKAGAGFWLALGLSAAAMAALYAAALSLLGR